MKGQRILSLGIKAIDDKTIEINYKEMNPVCNKPGGGIWSYATPKHVLKDIAIKDLESSDVVRKNPVTFGPYVMNKITPVNLLSMWQMSITTKVNQNGQVSVTFNTNCVNCGSFKSETI